MVAKPYLDLPSVRVAKVLTGIALSMDDRRRMCVET